MTQIVLPNTSVTGANLWSQVEDNDQAIVDVVNGDIGADNLASAAVTTAKIADEAITGAKLGAVVGCQLTRTTSQTIATSAGSFVALTFTTETYDSSGFHSNSTNTERLVAPVAGIYLVSGYALHEANGTGSRGLEIAKTTSGGSTTTVAQTFGSADGVFGNRQNVTGIVDLAANDYVTLGAFQNSGNSRTVDPKFFTIQLLGIKP